MEAVSLFQSRFLHRECFVEYQAATGPGVQAGLGGESWGGDGPTAELPRFLATRVFT